MKSSHWGVDGGDGGGGLGYRRGPQSVQSAEGGCEGGDCNRVFVSYGTSGGTGGVRRREQGEDLGSRRRFERALRNCAQGTNGVLRRVLTLTLTLTSAPVPRRQTEYVEESPPSSQSPSMTKDEW